MTPPERRAIFSFLTSACIIVVPFLAGAALVLVGISFYRTVQAGPQGESPGLSEAWAIIGPAWPMLAAAIVLAAVGIYSYRRVANQPTDGTK